MHLPDHSMNNFRKAIFKKIQSICLSVEYSRMNRNSFPSRIMGNRLIALTHLVKGLQLSTRQHDIQFREGKNKDEEGGEEQKEEYHRGCTEQNFHTWKCCVRPGVNTFPCTLLILSVLLPESLSGSQENTLLTYMTIMESGGAPL